MGNGDTFFLAENDGVHRISFFSTTILFSYSIKNLIHYILLFTVLVASPPESIIPWDVTFPLDFISCNLLQADCLRNLKFPELALEDFLLP